MKLSFTEKAYIIVALDIRIKNLKNINTISYSKDFIDVIKTDIETMEKIQKRLLKK